MAFCRLVVGRLFCPLPRAHGAGAALSDGACSAGAPCWVVLSQIL